VVSCLVRKVQETSPIGQTSTAPVFAAQRRRAAVAAAAVSATACGAPRSKVKGMGIPYLAGLDEEEGFHGGSA